VEPWQIAIVLRPFALLILFGAIVIPIELVLRRFWPEGQLKRILFARDIQERMPGRFMLVWLALMAALIAFATWTAGAWGATRDLKARAAFLRAHPCPTTGKPAGACPGYVVDHIRPLCAGGPDTPANMQWQTVAEAKRKDREEAAECRAIRKAGHRTP
jgi:hypothetical protein